MHQTGPQGPKPGEQKLPRSWGESRGKACWGMAKRRQGDALCQALALSALNCQLTRIQLDLGGGS